MTRVDSRSETFTVFAREVEPRLRLALSAAMGQQRGEEATSAALLYGWEHWDRIRDMDNPAGYLYRVGRRSVWTRHSNPTFLPVPLAKLPEVEPALPKALSELTERQRTAVFLVFGLGWTRRETAELLGVSINSVGSHLARGLHKLRNRLGVTEDE